VPDHRSYRACAPPEPLRDLVASFWIYDGYRPDHAIERVLPSATVELVVPLAGQRLLQRELTRDGCSDAIVSGPRRSRLRGADLLAGRCSAITGRAPRAGR
jgi:hypothetical protein